MIEHCVTGWEGNTIAAVPTTRVKIGGDGIKTSTPPPGRGVRSSVPSQSLSNELGNRRVAIEIKVRGKTTSICTPETEVA